MSVDMHEYKFILQLERLPYFTAAQQIDPDIARIDFSAWRALFSALLYWGHSTRYRLPAFDAFFTFCEKAYCHEEHAGRFEKWFEPADRGRTEQRFRAFYESGIAETYLYACLVDVFEDILKDGIVLYDARADWKQKWDVTVISQGSVFAIDSFLGSEGQRAGVKERRDLVERGRKANTMQSSHWENKERDRCIELRISRSDLDCQVVNGVRLFSVSAVNGLLDEIYETAAPETRFHFPPSRHERQRVYQSLIERK